MLRRKPTAITLTTEDLAIYEDTRQREAEQAAARAQAREIQERLKNTGMYSPQTQSSQNQHPNDELRPLPGDKARASLVRTREERLGLGRRS